MGTFGERLRQLRENNNLTQEQLGRILNVKKSAISKYETDKISMNIDSIKLLARYFDVPTSHLIDLEPNSTTTSCKLPILSGTVHTALSLLAPDNIEDYLDVPDYLTADFILNVRGDSMIGAGILDGDLAICRESSEFRNGQIIVVRKEISSEYSELSLKYYFDTGEQPVLRSANPKYSDIDFRTEAYSAVGQLVALIRRDAPDYDIYTDYLTIKDKEEWTEVIETAAEYGLTPQDILSSVNVQAKILKRVKGK